LVNVEAEITKLQGKRSKLVESDAGGILRSGVDQVRMDPLLSQMDAEMEKAIDHLERTMPRVLELWSKWFEEDGTPVPAPTFVRDEEAEPVELEEGVRMLGELRGVDPATVEIGMNVRATYIDFPAGESGPAWTLYAWEPAA
jgi:hypothetical protein